MAGTGNIIPLQNPMAVDDQGMDRAFAAGPLPAARTMIGTLLGSNKAITEHDFSPSELRVLREAVRKAQAEGRNYIGYGDYGEADPYASGSGAVVNALTQLPASLAFTLGMANFRKKPDGSVEIIDRYDFGAPRGETDRRVADQGGIIGALANGYMQNGLLGAGNVIGNVVAPRGEGRTVSITLPASPSGLAGELFK